MQIKTTMKYHFTSVRTAIIKKKKKNTKCWQGHGEKKTLVHYWRKCKLVQPLWKTVEVPQKTELVTYDSGIYLKENENTNWKRYFHPLCLTAASFTIAKTWKQPKCLSRNEWWRKHIYTHTMEYHKKKEILPFMTTRMGLEGSMLSEISQIEQDITVWSHLHVES